MKKLLFLNLLLLGVSNLFGVKITNEKNSKKDIKISVYSGYTLGYETKIGSEMADVMLNPGETKEIKIKGIRAADPIAYLFISERIPEEKISLNTFFKGSVPVDAEVFVLSTETKEGKVVSGAYYKDKDGKVTYLNKSGYQKAKKALGI